VRVRVAFFVAALCAVAASPAHATTPFIRQIECAVGGEEFNFTDTMSSSSFGQRPDGKPYSNWDYPLPVCPGNGLVMYRDFTAEELARLPDLIATPAYAELRTLAQPYYSAAYIERTLTPESPGAIWLLLQASWRVDRDAALKRRFQEEFVAAAQAAAIDPANQAHLMMRLRMANTLRELGRFDEADAAFAALLATPPTENAEGFVEYVEILRRVTARHDASAEPLDAIPRLAAASLCLEYENEAGWDSAGLCRETELAAEVERIRENRRQLREHQR
jgi:hypothetical protein